METKDKTIVAFHIGRGGRFHNAGHLSYVGEKRIGEFTNDLFTRFENQDKYKDRFGYDRTYGSDQKCILDLITDEEFEELELRFGITREDLGELMYYDGGGNGVSLRQKDVESGIGTINVDFQYDTTYTDYIENCTKVELEAIINSDIFGKDELIQKYFELKGYKPNWIDFNGEYESIVEEEFSVGYVDFDNYSKKLTETNNKD